MRRLPIDLRDFLRKQPTERYRSVLITGAAGSGKSEYARKLADSLSAPLVDLLALFLEDTDLASRIDTFDRHKLLDLLKLKANGEKVVVIDNPDFLINTWGDVTRREFCEWLGKLDSVQCPMVLCVFAQDDEAFSGVDYTPTSSGASRIIRFDDLQVI